MLKLIKKYQSGGLLDTSSMRNDLKDDKKFYRNGKYTLAGKKRLGSIDTIESNQDNGLRYSIDDENQTFKVTDKYGKIVETKDGDGRGVGEENFNPIYGLINKGKKAKQDVSKTMSGSSKYFIEPAPKLDPKKEEEEVVPRGSKDIPREDGESKTGNDTKSGILNEENIEGSPSYAQYESSFMSSMGIPNMGVGSERNFGPGPTIFGGNKGGGTNTTNKGANNGTGNLGWSGSLPSGWENYNTKVDENLSQLFSTVKGDNFDIFINKDKSYNPETYKAGTSAYEEEMRRRQQGEAPSNFSEFSDAELQTEIDTRNKYSKDAYLNQAKYTSENSLSYLDSEISRIESTPFSNSIDKQQVLAYLNYKKSTIENKFNDIYSNTDQEHFSSFYDGIVPGSTGSEKDQWFWDSESNSVVDKDTYSKLSWDRDVNLNKNVESYLKDNPWLSEDKSSDLYNVNNQSDFANKTANYEAEYIRKEGIKDPRDYYEWYKESNWYVYGKSFDESVKDYIDTHPKVKAEILKESEDKRVKDSWEYKKATNQFYSGSKFKDGGKIMFKSESKLISKSDNRVIKAQAGTQIMIDPQEGYFDIATGKIVPKKKKLTVNDPSSYNKNFAMPEVSNQGTEFTIPELNVSDEYSEGKLDWNQPGMGPNYGKEVEGLTTDPRYSDSSSTSAGRSKGKGWYGDEGVKPKPTENNKTPILSRTGINTPVGELQYNDVAQFLLALRAKNKKLAEVDVNLKKHVNSGSRNVLAARDIDSSALNASNREIAQIKSQYKGSDPVMAMISSNIAGEQKSKANLELTARRGAYRRQEEDRVAGEMETKRQQEAMNLQQQNAVQNENRERLYQAEIAKAADKARRDSEFTNNIGTLVAGAQQRANQQSSADKQFQTGLKVQEHQNKVQGAQAELQSARNLMQDIKWGAYPNITQQQSDEAQARLTAAEQAMQDAKNIDINKATAEADEINRGRSAWRWRNK